MVVDFNYTTVGLEVTFTNLSTGVPEGYTYLWDFGDGTSSKELSPVHEYPKSGFYKTSLSVLNEASMVISKREQSISVSDRVKTHLSDSIYVLINTYIPESIFGYVPIGVKKQFIEKWQLYIQPLVNHFIPVEEYANEMYYEALENQLIMELSAYDFMVTEISNMLKIIGAKAAGYSSDNNSSTTSPGISGGSIKKITTGPTEVEYFDSGSSISDELSSLTKFLQSDGVIDTIKQNICMLSSRLEIYLPICNSLPSKKVVPQVVNRREPGFIKGPDPIEITS